MKVNRIELVNVLEKVLPAVGINALVPEFEYFQIYQEKVQATDGVMLISTTLPVDVGFTCAIPGEPFLNLLRSLDIEDIELTYKNDSVVVRSDRVEGTFTVIPAANIREVCLHGSAVPSNILSSLVSGLAFCKFSVSKDATSGPIQGVKVKGTQLFSTDRFRIANWKLSEEVPFECSIPLKFVNVIEKIQPAGISQVYYAEEKDELIVMLQDGTYISTSVLQGEYPDLEQYFPGSEDEFMLFRFAENLPVLLERHIKFLSGVDAMDRAVFIEYKEGKCILTSRNKELGVLVEEFEVSKIKGSVKFRVNPMLLRDVASLCSDFKYFQKKKLMLFEADSFRYITRTETEDQE